MGKRPFLIEKWPFFNEKMTIFQWKTTNLKWKTTNFIWVCFNIKSPNPNFSKYFWNDYLQIKKYQILLEWLFANPNITKYLLDPPNTEIFKVFSVFGQTKCHSLVVYQDMEKSISLHILFWKLPSVNGQFFIKFKFKDQGQFWNHM